MSVSRATLRSVDGHSGVNFAVWAPNTQSVQVVGDFNHWDGKTHCMQKQIPSGIWELFVPNIGAGMKYKFRMRTADGQVMTDRSVWVFRGIAAAQQPRSFSPWAPIPGMMATGWSDGRGTRFSTNRFPSMKSIWGHGAESGVVFTDG
jgi:1,4-alpha-glucan branching enzyme